MISKVSFGSNAYTDKGNQYNKTNMGKKIGTVGLAAGTTALSVIGGGFKKETIELASKTLGSKGKYLGMFVLGLAMWTAIGTGVGAIVDAVINKTRKNKADNAQGELQAQMPQETEKIEK